MASAIRRLGPAGALLVVLLAVGCRSPFGVFRPAGPEAGTLSQIGWFLVALMSVTTLVMGFLIVVGALRRRGELDEHAPIDEGGGKGWILVGGLAIPVVVLAGLFGLTVATLGDAPGEETAGDPAVTIEVTAHQWWWEVQYRDSLISRRFTTANEIHVPVDRNVEIRLTSADVIHSFWVPRLHGKLDAIPGQTNRLVLQASEPGVYSGECAEYCGVQHANMRFLVVAEPLDEYRRWAERQRQPARTPEDSTLARGREAFMQHACAMCHRVRGTPARGAVGPDLTHFGSRRTLAAATYPNRTAPLHAWIVDAQSLKPGVKMPSMDQFDGRTLRALAAYLQSLK